MYQATPWTQATTPLYTTGAMHISPNVSSHPLDASHNAWTMVRHRIPRNVSSHPLDASHNAYSVCIGGHALGQCIKPPLGRKPQPTQAERLLVRAIKCIKPPLGRKPQPSLT